MVNNCEKTVIKTYNRKKGLIVIEKLLLKVASIKNLQNQ